MTVRDIKIRVTCIHGQESDGTHQSLYFLGGSDSCIHFLMVNIAGLGL